MSNALKLGGIIGLISAAVGLIIPKIFGIEVMFSSKYTLISSLVSLVLVVILGRKLLRPDDGDGTLYYGEALKYLFVAMIVSTIISTIPMAVVYGNDEKVEEAFQTYMHDTQIGTVKGMGKMMGQSEEEIEEMVEEMEEQLESGEIPVPKNPFSISSLPMTIFGALFSSFFIALITAIFVKKTK